MSERLRAYGLDRGGLLAVVTLVLYVWIAPHHVVDGDNAEFATLSVTGGAAHPSGYPLYVLWLRATSWLPAASPAHGAAIATALLGAAAVLVLHAACRAWGARPVSATVAVAIFATGPVVLRVVTEAEVFALNNLVVGTVLWLAAAHGPVRGASRAAALGLVAGLGLSDHLTCVLVAPVGILGIVRAAKETRPLVAMSLAIGGLVVGLAPYAYLVIAPDTPLAWGKVNGLEGVIAMFLREDYGGPTAFKPAAQEVSTLTNLGGLVATLGRAWWYVPALAGLAALAGRIARPGHEPRAGWITLGVAWLLAGPVLVLRFNVPPEGLGLYVCQRFHLLPALLLVVPVAQVFDRFPAWRDSLVTALVATVGVVGLAAASLPYVGRVHSPAVELSAQNMLVTLPRDAVIIHGQDELHAVTGYVQWARGVRRDVRVVTWPLMSMEWYRARVAGRGIVSANSPGSPQVQLVRALLARGVPVFVDGLQRDVIATFPSHPYGILMRALPEGAPLPTVAEVAMLNEQLYAQFALGYPRPGSHDEFATEVHRRYSATWSAIATMLERSGDRDGAARAQARARDLAPR